MFNFDPTRCPLACPHGDRCTLTVGHDIGCNHRSCTCNEPSQPIAVAILGTATADEVATALTASGEHIAQFFAFAHLPPHLAAVSAPFALLAAAIVRDLPRNPERTVALRKLLEAKDAAVRARLAK